MKFRTEVSLLLASWALLLAGSICGTAQAEKFRIETELFGEGEKEPLSRNLTLFDDTVVYDFLADPKQVTVFKHSRVGDEGRFILLNPARNERAELDTARVREVMAALQTWARQQKDPLLRFSGDPQFEETFDEEKSALVLEGQLMRYRVLTVVSRSEEATDQYREFSDWFAQLDSLLRPGSRPPFPRLEVNRSLHKKGMIPRQVEISFGSRRGAEPVAKFHTEHQLAWRHTRGDRQRIDEANEQLVNFTLVDLDTFRR